MMGPTAIRYPTRRGMRHELLDLLTAPVPLWLTLACALISMGACFGLITERHNRHQECSAQ